MNAQAITLIVVLIFGLIGFATGFIRSVGSIIGIFAGSVLATKHYAAVGGFLLPFMGNNQLLAGISGFILIFFAVSAVVGILAMLVDKLFNLVAIIPGLKAINKLGGFVLGLIEGALLVGVVLNAYTTLPLPHSKLPTVADPAVNKALINISKTVLPSFSSALKKAQIPSLPLK